ncbi:MAG: site-2 protease family protein [Patescibacteria group bacterium]|jgi:Zn-dependent protease
MLVLDLFSNPIAILLFVVALMIALTVHEFAHAWVALLLGDPTAKYHGRVTLNPLAHLDPIGTLLLFVAGFGWGKPVPVNPQYFARPALDELLVALAGPASNFLLATILGLAYQLLGDQPILGLVLILTMQINLFLMLFNLLPVPPLDGSKIIRVLFGEEAYELAQQSSLILIIALLVALRSTPLGTLLTETAQTLTRFLTGA